MGIRVVQRAFAPPSPYQYVPGRGRTTKEQAKRNRKELLFGCKSAPLDLKFSSVDQQKSRSEETVRTIHHQNVENWTTSSSRKTHNSASPLVQYRNTEMDISGNELSPELRPCQVAFENRQLNGQSPEPRKHSNGQVREKQNGDSKGQHYFNGTGDFQDEGIKDNVESPSRNMLSCEQDDDENEEKMADHYHALCGGKRPSLAAYLAGLPCPMAHIEKPFLLSDGKVVLSASLDKAIYSHGEEIRVKVHIKNLSSKTIKRIKVFVVQHVDVCMFSNGKFKNVVAMLIDKESCPIHAQRSLEKTYTLLPLNSITKNWIALEDSYSRSSSILASTVCSISNNPEDRNVFAIYVSYYVKVKLLCSVMGGDVSLKLPFTLMHTCTDFEPGSTLTRVQKVESQVVVEINKSTPSISSTATLQPQKFLPDHPNESVTENINPTTTNGQNTESKSKAEMDLKKKNYEISRNTQNLDEIVTIKKEDSEDFNGVGILNTNDKTIIKNSIVKNSGHSLSEKVTQIVQDNGDEDQDGGFRIDRVWCCLRTRRTS